MRGWFVQHRYSLAGAFARWGHAPLGTIFSILVLGIALSLPLGLFVMLDNLQGVSHSLPSEPQVSVYLNTEAGAGEVAQVDSRLKQNAKVRTYTFVPRETALQQLRQASGMADIIDSLPQNPLPHAFVVNAKDSTPQALEALRAEIKTWPSVDHVELDAAWARRLDAALRLARLLVAMLAGLVGLVLLAVTFNTIRLQVLTQREEIEVSKLIGATNAFIRRPFLYYGALQGALGALVAWAIVCAGIWLLNRNLGELSQVYASLFQLSYPRWIDGAALLLFSVAVNWAGASLSVGRHLALIERSDK